MRSVIAAFVTFLIVLAAVEVSFRTSGGWPSLTCGSTRTEFQWRVRRQGSRQPIFVVGDSRVDWGFAATAFSRRLESSARVGVNAGIIGSSVEKLLDFVVRYHGGSEPGVLVVNFSPAGFYVFENDPGPAIAQLKLQDKLDDAIGSEIRQWLFSYGQDPGALLRGFKGQSDEFGCLRRIVHPAGFVRGEFGKKGGSPADLKRLQLEFYDRILNEIAARPGPAQERKLTMISALRRARDEGWKVFLSRFPVGSRMRAIEERLPKSLRIEEISRETAIPLFDYQNDPRTANLSIPDESHLGPEAARVVALALADDLRAVLDQ